MSLITKIFPLSSVVLPEGKMNLRIFEPRYKRLVKECCQNGEGFVICLVSDSNDASPHNISQIGTLVEIVDFETLDDGLLGITVYGKQRIRVKRVWSEHDGLRVGEIEHLPNWQTHSFGESSEHVAKQLKEVYQQFPQVKKLYEQCFFDDATWVSQRWLELLPINQSKFDLLVSQDSCIATLDFLSDAIDSK
ncbi:putative Peptidase S16 (lon family) [Vibrio nigripulchritudo SFn27]|uniref:Putative Peptidase S16 (Lon family) n=1 Tax=Vibrio nigripulchritudo TaxID=28173 RepID=U4K288_9VIBR|nr:LON peptidase substrate-binding domain-containing protein [Vibrio nigripulchritudo]CCN83102.1 putative Peptidase S16 (lon family) [Vibrio nigripulchritudo BLFn1]CCN86294.1 putative Peptidase S16 (lon family) [Vibrio nigripulchritudo SFn27]CCN92854.1 putative Peptidase S16 (lon family) [Vibrio nigripulchritudo ENn2]CCO42710.1 putative Peptidase S16 (lon family) [Vibrio nigripulchritudo SFn135]CCO52576.1 putative Peptidase S16 (lon family) [Vibrio nigripulchritudo Wn13]